MGSEGAAAARVADELVEVSVAELRRRLAAGEVTSAELVRGYVQRIEAIDRSGPAVNSVIELAADPESLGAERDAARARGDDLGPLDGIPVLVKDNIATVDGMETTAGSLALVGARPARPAGVVRRLLAGGAVIFGKTNLSEWANFRSTTSSSGWSGRGGQTLNPYALDRTPSGSSSGSGAATAASLCAVSLGTETNGSILCPAAVSGLVGIKPTVGLTSRAGVIPISASQDTVGPMCRTVADAAALLTVIAGSDPDDPATADADRHATDYRRFVDPDGLRGARIGVARSVYWGYSPVADAIAERTLEVMREAGAEIVDPADIETASEMAGGWPSRNSDAYDILRFEFHDGINRWLSSLGDAAPAKDLAGLIEWNRTNADRELPYFGQQILEQAAEAGPIEDPRYREMRERMWRLSREEGIDRTLREHRLDAIVMPTMGPAVKIDLVNGEQHRGASSTPSAIAGYPAITVPAGERFGLPVGLTFTGTAWSEPTLIRLAAGFEAAASARFAPTYRPGAVLPDAS